MDLSNLKPAEGSLKTRKRIGRGQGSGGGGTATRGHKGAKSRSGYSKKVGFEGGQMPLQRRVPKFGFTNLFRVEYKAINIALLQKLSAEKGITEFKLDTFADLGLCSKNELIKVLGNGEVNAALTIEANAFSKVAQEKIVAAGGTATVLD